MRRLVVLVFAAALAGCSSSDPAGVVTPPPSPGATPASITISAGNGQQAEPGAAVAVKPAVLVTNASGQPVAGVTVTFAVDSGGGSLSATSAVTGSNGIAMAGTWTLGSAEGRNTIKVTVGTLAALRIAATAVVVGASFPATTIGTGGGSITVLQAGPINGFSVAIPGGASSANIPRTPVLNPTSPLITISTTTTNYATTPLTIHISAPTPANTFPVILVYDPASGATEVLTTIAWDANGVTALTNTLSGANILNSGASSVRRASLAAPGVQVFSNAIPIAVLMQDYDSGFRPGADDWEFTPTFTEITSTTSALASIGEAATSLWYYTARPSPVKLNGRFMQQATIPLSDRAGIRWATLTGTDYDEEVLNALINGLADRAASAAAFDQNQFLVVRSHFAVAAQNGGQPQPQLILLQAGVQAGGGVPVYLIAYRASGDRLYVSDQFFPGDVTRYIEFPSGAVMSAYTSGVDGTVAFIQPLAMGLSSLIPLTQFPADYAQVLNGTIGQAQFPSYEIHGWAGRLYDTLFVVDTLRWWFQCPACKYSFATTLSPSPGANIVAGSFYSLNPLVLLGSFPKGGFLSSSNPPAGTEIAVGLAVASATAAQEQTGPTAWLDWHQFTLRRLQTSILPAAPTQWVGNPLVLSHQVNAALLPASVTYSWDFGDKTAKVQVSNNPNVSHTYTTPGIYTVTAEILDDRNTQVIARSTATATITADVAWQFTSVSELSFTPPPGGVSSQPVDVGNLNAYNRAFAAMQSTPAATFFYLHTVGNCSTLVLEQFMTVPNPPVFDPNDTFGLYGANCSIPAPFTASLTMGALGSGGLSGFSTEPGNVQQLTGGAINATMNGKTLTGTFTWRAYFSTGNGSYTATFVATQVLP
jgi:PKD domain